MASKQRHQKRSTKSRKSVATRSNQRRRKSIEETEQIWLSACFDARDVMERNFEQSTSTRWRFQNRALWNAFRNRSQNSTRHLHAVYSYAFDSPWSENFGFARAKTAHRKEMNAAGLPCAIEAPNNFTNQHLEWFADWVEAEISWQFYLSHKATPTPASRLNGVEGHREMTSRLLAELPQQINLLSAAAFAELWQGGSSLIGKHCEGLVADCQLSNNQDWQAILVRASKIKPAAYGFLDVDRWLWKIFPLALHNNWTATEAAQLVREKFGSSRVPGQTDENGFAQHFRKIGLRFSGKKKRNPIPGRILALNLDTSDP